MDTTLVAGTAVPPWDVKLMASMLAAVQRASPTGVVGRIAITNAEGSVYRRVTVNQHHEFALLLIFLVTRGFELRVHGGEFVALWAGDKAPDA